MEVLRAVALVLIAEGLVYALAPSLVERVLEMLRMMPIDQRRLLGLASAAAGVAMLWAVGMG